MKNEATEQANVGTVEAQARDLGASVANLMVRTLEQSSSLVEHVLVDSGKVADEARRLGLSILYGLQDELVIRGKHVRADRQK